MLLKLKERPSKISLQLHARELCQHSGVGLGASAAHNKKPLTAIREDQGLGVLMEIAKVGLGPSQ
jgi:hypothetical protein